MAVVSRGQFNVTWVKTKNCTMCVVISVYKDIMELELPLLRLRSSKQKVHWSYFSVNYFRHYNSAAKEQRTTVVLHLTN